MNADDQWNQPNAYAYPQNGYVQAENAFPYPENSGADQYNENVPINDAQYTDYGGGEAILTGPNITLDAPIVGPRQLTHIPGERDFHWQFIRRHLQQVKPFAAAFILLFVSGLHVAWGIYQALFYDPYNVFGIHLRRDELKHLIYQDFGLIFSIASWYAGVMLGSAGVGFYLAPNVTKRTLYSIASALMLISSSFFIVFDEENWDTGILLGRFVAGICHGFIYVLVFVQASENSSKEFREMLVIIIGAWIMFCIYMAATIFLHEPMMHISTLVGSDVSNATSAILIGSVSIMLSIVAFVVNNFYTLETVPFLIKHNYKLEESLYLLSRLRNEPMESPGVLSDFEELKRTFESDMAQFGDVKLFTKENRSALYHGIFGRIVGMLASCTPAFIIIVRHLFNMVVPNIHKKELDESLAELKMAAVNASNATDLQNDIMANIDEGAYDVGLLLSYMLLLSTIHGWFAFGFWATYLSNRLNWRRNLYLCVSLFGFVLLAFTLAETLGFFNRIISAFAYLSGLLFLYFLSWPLNIYGYFFLTDGYPTSLNSRCIGFISVVEHGAHILIIAMYLNMRDSVGFLAIIVGLVFTVLGYKLYLRTTYTKGMPLLEARLENQRTLLMQSFSGGGGPMEKLNRFL